mmetsp:Transcript_9891/g.18857  ORF Transcript_9891/g.18857 Transcript_9891/m.18857 type:complete len:343 (+) Transcript_9891:456-1484(+)
MSVAVLPKGNQRTVWPKLVGISNNAFDLVDIPCGIFLGKWVDGIGLVHEPVRQVERWSIVWFLASCTRIVEAISVAQEKVRVLNAILGDNRWQCIQVSSSTLCSRRSGQRQERPVQWPLLFEPRQTTVRPCQLRLDLVQRQQDGVGVCPQVPVHQNLDSERTRVPVDHNHPSFELAGQRYIHAVHLTHPHMAVPISRSVPMCSTQGRPPGESVVHSCQLAKDVIFFIVANPVADVWNQVRVLQCKIFPHLHDSPSVQPPSQVYFQRLFGRRGHHGVGMKQNVNISHDTVRALVTHFWVDAMTVLSAAPNHPVHAHCFEKRCKRALQHRSEGVVEAVVCPCHD